MNKIKLTVFNNKPNMMINRANYKHIQRKIEFRADKKLKNGKWQNNIQYIFQIDSNLLIEREEIDNKNGPSYKTTLKYKIIDYNVIQNRTFKRKNRINFNVCNIKLNNNISDCGNVSSIDLLQLSVKENYNYLINTLHTLGGSKKKTKSPKIHIGPRGGKYIKKKGKKIYIK